MFRQQIWTVFVVFGLSLALSACAFGQPSHEYGGTLLSPPKALPDFELTATNGEPYRLSDNQGEITLIYFGYTFCPDVCPMTLWDVHQALEGLEGKDRVNTVMITVDPNRDTPEVLERYVTAFDESFVGLTTTDNFEQLDRVMAPYGANAVRNITPDSQANYLVDHTALVFLVNPEGELMLTYPFGFLPEHMQADLEYILQEYEL